jgi:hypothetical protein
MRLARSSLLILTCLGLLVSQLSGLHMHVDMEGYAGAPHATHVHETDLPVPDLQLGGNDGDVDHHHPSDPGHEGERDISIMELGGAGVSKVLIFFAWFCLVLLVIPKRDGRIPLPATTPRTKTRRERWRPPLRAPPLPSAH